MKKFLFLMALVAVFAVVACQKESTGVSDGKMDQTKEQPVMQSDVTGDAAVDSIGSDLSDAEAAEKELSGEGIEDIDSGLQDIENI